MAQRKRRSRRQGGAAPPGGLCLAEAAPPPARRWRQGLAGAALALAVLAAAAAVGEFCALWQLSGRVAALEQAAQPAVAKALPPHPTPSPAPACLPAETAALYPALQGTPLPAQLPPPGTVYLTFDDGPSANTEAILAQLAEYGAKATWFVVGTQLAAYPAQAQGIASQGHALALHSDTHEYSQIYASPQAFLADLDAVRQRLEALTGQQTGLVRFAGGSINQYDAGCYQELTASLLARGLRYYDWNVSAQDAVRHSPAAGVIAQRVIDGVLALDPATPAVVLMHDTKATTPAALPQILKTLSAQGYRFAALDSSVPMVAFAYPDSGGTAPAS